MKKTLLYSLLCTAVCLLACNKFENVSSVIDQPMTVRASMNTSDTDVTKTSLNMSTLELTWAEGDNIRVFSDCMDPSSNYGTYWDNECIFTIDNEDAGKKTASFTYSNALSTISDLSWDGVNRFVAYYPGSIASGKAQVRLNSTWGSANFAYIKVSLPSDQTYYSAGGPDPKLLAMRAEWTDNPKELDFKHLFCILRLPVYNTSGSPVYLKGIRFDKEANDEGAVPKKLFRQPSGYVYRDSRYKKADGVNTDTQADWITVNGQGKDYVQVYQGGISTNPLSTDSESPSYFYLVVNENYGEGGAKSYGHIRITITPTEGAAKSFTFNSEVSDLSAGHMYTLPAIDWN